MTAKNKDQSGSNQIPALKPEQVAKAKKRFDWLLSFLIVRYRFVHHIIGMLLKVPDNRIPTMGVRVLSNCFELRYNPAWVENLKDEEVVFVFYHEIMHLVLHHCTIRSKTDKQVWNIATDLAVNTLVPVEGGSCEPPKDTEGKISGCFVDEIKKQPWGKNIKDKQNAEYYYDFLMENMPKVEIGQYGSGDGQSDGQDQSGKSQGQNDKYKIDEHGGWDENEIADEKVRKKVQEVDKLDLWGNTSQADRELIMAAQTKKINWRAFIRTFAGNILWREKRHTRKRPNRRTGYAHPGSKRIHVDRLLVALDSSGSVFSSPDLIGEFISTINGMTEFFPVDMLQFDAEITEKPHPWDNKKINYTVKGGGGTNFEDVMQTAIKQRYKACIVLTDGIAPAPTRPPATKVLWCLPAGDYKPPVDWGLVIHLRKHT